MRHICVSERGHHWFILLFNACPASSHYLIQCWLIVNWALSNQFIQFWINRWISFIKKCIWKYFLQNILINITRCNHPWKELSHGDIRLSVAYMFYGFVPWGSLDWTVSNFGPISPCSFLSAERWICVRDHRRPPPVALITHDMEAALCITGPSWRKSTWGHMCFLIMRIFDDSLTNIQYIP